MSNDLTRLRDILEASEEALEYVFGYSRESFLADRRTIRACERCLEIVGEAAARLTDECQAKHPDIPWHRAKGMRNIIIHEYGAVQYDIIYETVVEHLPTLVEQIRSVLES